LRRREFEAVEWDRILRRGRKGSGDLPGLQSRFKTFLYYLEPI
jgi:hypothetical protein